MQCKLLILYERVQLIIYYMYYVRICTGECISRVSLLSLVISLREGYLHELFFSLCWTTVNILRQALILFSTLLFYSFIFGRCWQRKMIKFYVVKMNKQCQLRIVIPVKLAPCKFAQFRELSPPGKSAMCTVNLLIKIAPCYNKVYIM